MELLPSVIAAAILCGGAAVADQNDPRLDELFRALAVASSANQAAHLEDEIWQLWFETDERDVAEPFERGVAAMQRGDHGAALRAFDAVVAAAPEFAEGWNRRATLHFLMGDFEASVRDIETTLALEPRHFGALSGLAMIREAQGQPFEALEALERVMRIHPRLPHLQDRIDRISELFGESV
jgi:tetratricopeptide (TPR) repeat protein